MSQSSLVPDSLKNVWPRLLQDLRKLYRIPYSRVFIKFNFRSTPGWWKTRGNAHKYSTIELHAELVHTECSFFLGFLSILRSVAMAHLPPKEYRKTSLVNLPFSNIVSLPRPFTIPTVWLFHFPEFLFSLGEPAIHSLKGKAKIFYTHLRKLSFVAMSFIYKNSFERMLKSFNDGRNGSFKSKTEEKLHNEVECGAQMILGLAMLLSEVVPKSFLDFLDLKIPFEGNKKEGIEYLVKASQMSTLRQIIANCVLLSYQLVVADSIGPIDDFDSESCYNLLHDLSENYPKASRLVANYFAGRRYLLQKQDFSQALSCFGKVSIHKMDKEMFQVDLSVRYRVATWSLFGLFFLFSLFFWLHVKYISDE